MLKTVHKTRQPGWEIRGRRALVEREREDAMLDALTEALRDGYEEDEIGNPAILRTPEKPKLSGAHARPASALRIARRPVPATPSPRTPAQGERPVPGMPRAA